MSQGEASIRDSRNIETASSQRLCWPPPATFRRAGQLLCCCYARRPCCRRRDMGVLRASVAKTSLSTPVDGVIAGSK
jgi:hypothetical protein